MLSNLFKILYNLLELFKTIKPFTVLNNFLKKNPNFNDVLEFPKNYNFKDPKYDLINTIPETHPLVITVKNFIEKFNKNDEYLVVSLSGGVDSMVLISILWKLSKDNNFKIASTTIDYNIRPESNRETLFVKQFCQKYGINFYCKTVENVSRKTGQNSRNEYEETSKNIRFDLYNSILKKHSGNGIYVAHHYDDITENVFTNIMKGSHFLDLSVMHECNSVKNINIYRPFLNHKKDTIFDFAHTYKIPYFKNTTPKWCKRGILREQIFKILESTFGSIFRKNLNDLGAKTYEIGNLINETLINPQLENLHYHKYGCQFQIPKIKNRLFWEILIQNIFSKLNTSYPSKKSISVLIDYILDEKNTVYPLKKGFYAIVEENELYIVKDYFSDVKSVEFIEDSKKNESEINLVDVIKGSFEYYIPANFKLKNNNINSRNILSLLKINKIPLNLTKYLNLPSFEIDKSKLNSLDDKWKKITITY